MKNNGLVDEVIQEPLNGAHRNQEEMFRIVKGYLKTQIEELSKKAPKQRIDERIEKFNKMGVWK
jgi:acetyl-CoA carboxylase carboxyl transferase subunit alpha